MSAPTEVAVRWVRRFDRADRILHGFLMLSFLGLASTGMPLLFSHAPWASVVARAFGGFESAGTLHRLFAIILIAVFLTHVWRLLRRVVMDKDYGILWGPSSIVPQPRDLADMAQHFLWFIGRAPRPGFERFSYWEKFDYWAVFWGMAIIGGSGILLWFPQFFARFIPGWMFNVAFLVHGEEALLAVGFIFTIHFFNGHLRPEKFPMDMVIFTGVVSEAELAHERPGEYERLRRSGQIEPLLADAPSARAWTIGRLVGTTAIVVGLSLVLLIVYALVM
ncbi:MAG TPA: cytochrome b/b6 domain-containing protein [Vicinamibacterales bacterium]|nr:cytochrome b/b6 domain-containing protein [Vicinamibacterales bacterium]